MALHIDTKMNRPNRNFTEELRDRLSIVDVVERHVPVVRKGKSYWCCCPFHTEKTASMKLDEERQCYHCFGCGDHGDIISFTMKYNNVEFWEALVILADLAGIDLPSETKKTEKQKEKERKYSELLRIAEEEYHRRLFSRAGDDAMTYLLARGFSVEQIKKYKIGFAPDCNLLSEKFISESTQNLVMTGLVRTSENGSRYDFFRNRIMFPIKNQRGETIAFSGRSLDGVGPKYVNSSDTEFFHKRQTLFGIDVAKSGIYRANRSIIVEGQIDAIKMQLAGYTETVAPLGSSLTVEHIETLCKVNRNIVLCFDGDVAGHKAAARAARLCLPFMRYSSDVRIVILPSCEDPDSILSADGGATVMAKLIKQAKPIVDFLWEDLVRSYNTREIMGRVNLKKAIRELVAQIQDKELKDDISAELNAKMLRRFYSKREVRAMAKQSLQ
jgi:DNA primase